MRSIIHFILSFFIFAVILQAQGKVDTTLSFSMDSIVVYSSRYSIPLNDIPYTIDVIDNAVLENISNPLTIEEVLSNQPGIIVNNRTNLAQGDKLTIRGIGTRSQFGIRGIKIFLDGIPLTFSDGQTQLNNLNIQEIQSAEILKGPASVIYGNSLGGIILLSSRSTKGSNFNLKPSITIGSYGLQKYNLSSGIRISADFKTSLSAYYSESNGYRKHSDARYYGINLVSKYSPSENFTINIINNYYKAPYLLNASSLNKKDAMDNPESVRSSILNFASAKKVEQLQNGIGLEYVFSEKTKIRTTLYSVIRKLDNSIPGRIIDLKRNFGGIRTEFVHDFKTGELPIKLLTGIDYEFQYDDREEFENGGIPDASNIKPSKIFEEIEYSDLLLRQEENVTSWGTFLHLNLQLNKKLKIFAGIRYDDILFEVKDDLSLNSTDNISMNNLSYMTGFNYKLFKNITAFGNLASGFQTPTTNELSNNPFGSGFNNDLDPEKVNNYELGIKSFIDGLDLFGQFSIFKMDFKDLLIGYQSESEEIFYRNAGKAENLGIEAAVQFSPFQDIELRTSYTFMDFIFTDYLLVEEINGINEEFQLKDNNVPGVPKNRFTLALEYLGITDFGSRLILSFFDDYFTNDFNGPIFPSDGSRSDYINDSYLKIDLLLNYKINIVDIPLSLGIKFENITDERYNGSVIPNAFGNNFFEPAPGRSYFLNLGIDL